MDLSAGWIYPVVDGTRRVMYDNCTMLPVNDLRRGMAIVLDGSIHKVVEQKHVKPGKGGAFVRCKLKRIDTGATIDRTFRSAEKVEQAVLTEKQMEYLYRDGNQMYFMDKETYEQAPVSVEEVADAADTLPENTNVTFVMHGKDLVEVVPPDSVEVTVAETDPGVRGDTASGGSKPATTTTGAVVQVPLFIEKGDKITVNTRTGKYLGRA